MIIIPYPEQFARIAERWWGPKGWRGLWQTIWMALSKTRRLPVLERSSWKSQKSLPQEVRHGATRVCRVKEVSSLQRTKQMVPRHFFQGCESPPQQYLTKSCIWLPRLLIRTACPLLPGNLLLCVFWEYMLPVWDSQECHGSIQEQKNIIIRTAPLVHSAPTLCPHSYWKASSERLNSFNCSGNL